MNTLYIYFSGTGNTKWVVEKFADLYETVDDFSIVSIEHSKTDFPALIMEASCIILAYPIHGMMPFIVSEFLETHLESFTNKKVITICTQLMFSGDGGALPYYILKKVGVQLLHSIHINMPSNLTDVPMLLNKPLSDTAKKYKKAKAKLCRVVEKIKAGQIIRDGRKWFSRALGYCLQRGPGKPMLKDKVKINTSSCVVCTKCVRICPVQNLFIEHGVILQHSHCTLCYRCVNSCPRKSISIIAGKGPKVQYIRDSYN